MIVGGLDVLGQPYVRCEVFLPRLMNIPFEIDFVVDTGAHRTSVYA